MTTLFDQVFNIRSRALSKSLDGRSAFWLIDFWTFNRFIHVNRTKLNSKQQVNVDSSSGQRAASKYDTFFKFFVSIYWRKSRRKKKMGENWTKVQTRFMVKNCKKRTCDVASAFHILHDSNQPRRQHAPNRKLTTHQPNGSDSTMFLCARWCQKKCSLLLTIDMRLNARNSRCCCRSQDKFEPRTKDSRDDNTQKNTSQ